MVEERLDEEPQRIPDKYQRLRLLVSTTDEDRLVAELWSLGSLGVESTGTAIDQTECLAYFTLPLQPVVEDLTRGRQTVAGAKVLEVAEVAEEDWQRAYRRRSVPFAVGKRWWVDPREPGRRLPEPPNPRRLLRIPARTAFGTGSHASTALIVELMEGVQLTGGKVLDVGTGSGILAMVALASGAESVTALDTDPVAAFVALETCRLNGLVPHLLAGGLASIASPASREAFDVVVANVLPSRLRSDFPRLGPCLKPSGVLLLSGLLQEQQPQVLSEMSGLGWHCRQHLRRQDWVALRLERDRP